MTAPHWHGTTPAQRAVIGITPSTRSRMARRANRTTGLRTTPAPRAISRTRRRTTPGTTGIGPTEPARRARGQHNRLITAKRACRPRAPDAERVARQPRCLIDRDDIRAEISFQNAHDL